MPASVLTDRERRAVQAYLRLLHTVRAAYDPQRPVVVPPSVLAEAEQALTDAGLRGNEEDFFQLLRTCQPRG
jgi:hypothetical protein